ncbi:hypothetical protein CR513_52357, partial [Mucuna pruriens]
MVKMSRNGSYWFDMDTSEMSSNRRFRRHACCECGGRVKVYTSRTSRNPGRRFLRCPNYRCVDTGGMELWFFPLDGRANLRKCGGDHRRATKAGGRSEEKKLVVQAPIVVFM